MPRISLKTEQCHLHFKRLLALLLLFNNNNNNNIHNNNNNNFFYVNAPDTKRWCSGRSLNKKKFLKV